MKSLVKLTQAKTVLEVGMFTGTSSLAMAEALPSDGKVKSQCLVSNYAQHAAVASEVSTQCMLLLVAILAYCMDLVAAFINIVFEVPGIAIIDWCCCCCC